MAISYQIGAVSKLTGISVDTLRAWERRYAAVAPKRGNLRRDYDEADVERLILLRRAVEQGHPIGSVARLANEEVRNLLGDRRNLTGGSEALIQPLLIALEDFNYEALRQQLGRMAAVLSPQDIVYQVVMPAMREVGERWHRGQLSTAQEHMISGLFQQLLGTLMGLHHPAPNAVRLIFTTPEGELHALGILAAAMLAAGAGLSPIYLGPNLPAKDIVHAARRSAAKAVVLQISDSSNPGIAEQIASIKRGLPANVELWIGGNRQPSGDGTVALYDFALLDDHYRRLMAVA